MRTNFFILIIALFITACGGGSDEEPQTLEEREAKVKELRKQVAELNAKITALEGQINDEKGIDPADALRQVEVFTLANQTFEHFIEVQGNVQSDKDVQVFPKMGGAVIRKNVKEGQRVSKGQTLMVLDAATINKQIEEIEKRLELATVVFERQENLWKQKIGSELQYLQAKNDKEALEKTLATTKTQLANATVTAPISGTIDEFFLNEGEMANPAQPVLRIVNLATVEISADVSEAYTKSIRKGDKVLVKFPAINEEMPVRVSLIGQTINEKNRTFRIEMKAPNKQGYLKPNAMAVVRIKDFAQENAMIVPSHLVQQSTSGERFLYVVNEDDGKKLVRKVVIKVGQSYQGNTLITSGLKAGDKVVIKGYNEIVDGEEVRTVEGAKDEMAMNP
ncbi:MAG: efflux RND transporter periplasmic adaptor subunit [Flammeovirgaceae bacterium]